MITLNNDNKVSSQHELLYLKEPNIKWIIQSSEFKNACLLYSASINHIPFRQKDYGKTWRWDGKIEKKGQTPTHTE